VWHFDLVVYLLPTHERFESKPMNEYSAGKLLVASPSVVDPLFARSVCLVMQHDATGAIGLLLNRPLQAGPSELWNLLAGSTNSASRIPSASSRCVHFGGPMSGPVVALHDGRQWAEAEPTSGVYVAAQKSNLQHVVSPGAAQHVRLIIGHAAWQSGQLEAEIAAGIWYPLPATADRVFAADETMWPRLVRIGVGHSLASWVGVDDSRVVPALN
jgi:putative transcriptional regulator